MKIFITQPTFFPWLGYFDLIDQSQKVVFLDDVDFTKQSWQQRNNFKTTNGLETFTIPVDLKNSKTKLIKDILIFNRKNISRKFHNFLKTNYNKSIFFEKYIDEINKIFDQEVKRGFLFSLNYELIKWSLKILDIKKDIILSSSLNFKSKKSKKIIDICKDLKANEYLSTPGSLNYLNEDLIFFNKNDIKVFMHQYDHPRYKQNFGNFYKFACVLDLIFNEGPQSKEIIKLGRKKSKRIV